MAQTTHEADEDSRNRDILIYVNGDIVHRDEAKVSVYDAGFMLGDGIWEGMRLYQGTWAFFDEHMDRFFNSCKAIDLDVGMDKAGIAEALHRTAEANGMTDDVHCRLMLTRGIKDKPFQHPGLSTSGPTLVIIMEHSRPVDRLQSAGISLAAVAQVRGLPHTQDPKLNSHSKLNCIIACLQAEAAGADEALMLDPHGFVNTTNACNFFIVRRGEVWTSTGDYCMNGVTRQKVIDLCVDNGIPVYEKNFSLYEAYGADEAFLTGTFGAQTPVASIDGKVIGNGERPVTRTIQGMYKDLIKQHVNGALEVEDGMTGGPRSYLEPLNLRGRISTPQPKGLPLVNLGFNELPYGPSPKVAAAVAEAAAQVASYGTPLCDGLRDRLAQVNGLDADRIICGNGSEELLDVIARNFVRPGDEVLISAYGYIQFQMVAARQGATLVKGPEVDFTSDVDALLGAVTAQTRLVFLANPNNPTGTVLPVSELSRLVEGMPPHVVVVLDLAYGEFTGFDHCAEVHALAGNRKNVIVTRTFSKAYGLAGLRCGWAHAPFAMMPSLYAARGMGSVNRLAQAAATAALADMDVVKARVAEIVSERERVAAALAGIGIVALPSGTNFLLVRVDGKGAEAAEALVVHFFEDAGIIVSRTREAGLEDWLRFCLGTPDQNDLLLQSAQNFMERLA